MDRVGFLRRIVAYLIDVVLSLLFGVALYVLVFYSLQTVPQLQQIEQFYGYNLPLWQILGTTLFILAPAVVGLSEVFFARSPGKLILGLVIRSEGDRSPSILQLTMRWFLKYHLPLFQLMVLAIPGESEHVPLGVISFIIGIGTIGVFFPNRQTLYDRVSFSAIYSVRKTREKKKPQPYDDTRGQCLAADQLLFK